MSDGQVHSKIGASSMYRWSMCPGSVRLSEGLEKRSSVYAEAGTRAHAIAAQWLQNGIVATDCDEETLNAVQVYVETVLRDSGEKSLKTLVEVRFDLSSLFPGLYGTADAVVYDPSERLLRVYDYKHGEGVLVDVENSSQLQYYALGALLSGGYHCNEIELVIVQPRADHPDGHVRRWRFDALKIIDFAMELYDFAKKTTEANAPLVPGSHCRFCNASGICPALRAKALTLAQTEFKPTLSYDPIVLSETLKKLDMLEGYAKSVREFAYGEAEHGRCPPGYKLVQKRATRKWRDEEKVAVHWKQVFGEAAFEKKLKSPAQIEKMMLASKTGAAGKMAVQNECVLISSGLVLVEDTDKRPAALMSAASEFTKIGDEC